MLLILNAASRSGVGPNFNLSFELNALGDVRQHFTLQLWRDMPPIMIL